jgi:hypothetical protein
MCASGADDRISWHWKTLGRNYVWVSAYEHINAWASINGLCSCLRKSTALELSAYELMRTYPPCYGWWRKSCTANTTLAYCAELLDPASSDSSISSDSSVRDPHPSTSKLKTLNRSEQGQIASDVDKIDCDFFRRDSEYGTPVAIWEMLHNSCD